MCGTSRCSQIDCTWREFISLKGPTMATGPCRRMREEGVVLGHLLHHRLEDGSVDVVGVDALDCGVKDQLLLQLVGAEEAADADESAHCRSLGSLDTVELNVEPLNVITNNNGNQKGRRRLKDFNPLMLRKRMAK
ncbi:hypothetical protein TYRP_021229 [Tyrophagus putrescentiae]|nr:hypothetical protein TYRP_021229 [Tyrophagus putrescentiae]